MRCSLRLFLEAVKLVLLKESVFEDCCEWRSRKGINLSSERL